MVVSNGRTDQLRFWPRTAPTAGASTYHKGIDIATPTGTIVRAKAGTVVTATYSASAGNFVAIYHGDGVYTYYMHNSSLRVSVGEKSPEDRRLHCPALQESLPVLALCGICEWILCEPIKLCIKIVKEMETE